MVQNSQQNGAFDQQKRSRRLIRKFGIVEIVLAVLCFILGIIGTVLINKHNSSRRYYSSGYYGYYVPSIGSGIWSSIFTVIAGGIGIGIGSPSAGKGMMIAHMTLAIIGCVSEMMAFITSSVVCATTSHSQGAIMFIYIALCIFSIVNFSLLITTSAFCCKLLTCCCGSATDSGYQMAYVPQTVVQTPHGMMMIQQPQGTVMMQQPARAIMIQQPQGAVMMQQPAGGVMMQQPQGTVMMQQPAGGVMMQQPAGAVMMQQPQGTVMMQQPQGTVMKQQTQGFPPQYYQPQTNSQDTSNLINSEEVAQPQETKVAPPSYS